MMFGFRVLLFHLQYFNRLVAMSTLTLSFIYLFFKVNEGFFFFFFFFFITVNEGFDSETKPT